MEKKIFTIKCDICGKEIQGKSYPVYNENFKIEKGLKQCEKCYAISLGMENENK